MSRSGYTDDCENLNLYRGTVERAIRGKRGQKLLKDLAAGMDAMPAKRLIDGELITTSGDVCALGVVGKSRKLPGLEKLDPYEPQDVADFFDISISLAMEVSHINDENFDRETPEQRWIRVRKWVNQNLNSSALGE